MRGARSAAARHVRLRGARRDAARRARSPTCRSWCSPARSCRPEEDARLHTMARSIVVKGVESPERLLDETALFLHRVVTDLPPEKQRMLERLQQLGRGSGRQDRAAGRRRRAQHLRAVERAGTPRHEGADRDHRQRGDRACSKITPDLAIVLMDIMMPEMDGYQTIAQDPRKSGLPPPADHRADGEGHEGRPREMPGGRRVGLSRQAGQHRAAACPRCACGCIARLGWSAMLQDDKVNILLVDDQPAKLLAYEAS